MPSGTPSRRRGRPARRDAPDGPGARERILEAARAEFAERGYDRTSIRGVARKAGVDPALVHHYFGSKERVFETSIEKPFEPVMRVPDLLAQGRDGMGERLARHFLGVWENPATRAPVLALMRSALTNETAAALLRGFVTRRLLERVAGDLDVPEPELRIQLAVAQLLGVAVLRYVIKVEPLAGVDAEEVVAQVAPVLQRHLTGA
ncbi:TetR/AcrR family transcriptional regulator [Streptomyces zingiberis]|uniref:TetR/AcrR family transcriptional regulator n=1 Tax=Streptomyces zingiberis TaxID=2053010 RepID=A0ABX1C148_9ACTN|nr:TetR family transcriptional regulator [Streptomyces zingiberis]NJQ03645.1 TetR/AcrR family transcriptional regulator [Streptomyces zingiberis]